MPPSARPETRTEGQNVVDKLAHRDSELRQENEEISAYLKVAKGLSMYAWFLGTSIVGITLWLGKMQWDQTRHKDQLTEIMAFNKAADKIQVSNQMFDLSISNTVDANRRERMNAIENLTSTVTANRRERMDSIENLNVTVNRQQVLLDKWTARTSQLWFARKDKIHTPPE